MEKVEGAPNGISPSGLSFNLEFGTLLHSVREDLARFDQVQDWGLLEDGLRQMAEDTKENPEEVVNLGLGLATAYQDGEWPRLREHHEPVLIEAELIIDLPHTSTKLVVKPDLVWKRDDGVYLYDELKTAAWVDTKWLGGWEYNHQVQLGLRAASRFLDVPMEGAWVQAFVKGSVKDGERRSPFTVLYKRMGKEGWSPRYERGWEKQSVSKYPGGVRRWVSDNPQWFNFAFPRTVVIPPDDVALDRWLESVGARERLKEEWRKGELPDHAVWGENWQQCSPSYGGFECPYLAACWSKGVREDPVGSGLYVPRVPHHQTERRELGIDEEV